MTEAGTAKVTIACPMCDGRGYTVGLMPSHNQRWSTTCQSCKGYGTLKRELTTQQSYPLGEIVKRFSEPICTDPGKDPNPNGAE